MKNCLPWNFKNKD